MVPLMKERVCCCSLLCLRSDLYGFKRHAGRRATCSSSGRKRRSGAWPVARPQLAEASKAPPTGVAGDPQPGNPVFRILTGQPRIGVHHPRPGANEGNRALADAERRRAAAALAESQSGASACSSLSRVYDACYLSMANGHR